ncbi:MAG: hypothetical protein RIB46_04055 [Pseudomonadales bacterium]
MNTRQLRPIALGLVLIWLQAGCVTSTVQEIREANTGMGAGESIVVMGRRTLPSNTETEYGFVSCVSKGIGGGSKGLRVIDEQSFRDAMFPWFEPRTAPANTSDLPELINHPVLAERLQELGLRYLVWIEGDTDRTDSGGSMTCSVTTAGAGCFGFLTWENDSSYEASVWDVRTGTSAGRISSEAVGTSYMPAVIVPLPFIARVRGAACSRLADQLKTFLTAEG